MRQMQFMDMDCLILKKNLQYLKIKEWIYKKFLKHNQENLMKIKCQKVQIIKNNFINNIFYKFKFLK